MSVLWKWSVGIWLTCVPWFAHAEIDVVRDRMNIHGELMKQVSTRDFAAVDRQVQKEVESQARLTDGTWRLTHQHRYFRVALDEQITGESAWKDATTRLVTLAKTRPGALLLLADAHLVWAWQVRGSGTAMDVRASDWPVFKQHVMLARDILEKNKTVLSNNPEWYRTRLEVANYLAETESEAWQILEESSRRAPAYPAPYFEMMRYLSPNWHGSPAKLQDMLVRVAAMDAKTSVAGLYARLISYAEDTGYWMTRGPRVDPQEFRNSVDQWIAASPHEVNVQIAFKMACERSDKALTAKLAQRLQGPAIPDIWSRNVPVYTSCKEWAEGRLEMFVMVHHFLNSERTEDFLIR